MNTIGSAGGLQQIMALRQQVLDRNQALQDLRSATGATEAASPQKVNGPDQVSGFADALGNALKDVSAVQNRSSDIQAAYERGEVTDIAQVMLARQESGVAFEATLQVRNKLLTAYQEIMRMGS